MDVDFNTDVDLYLEVLPVVYPDVSVLARSDEVEAVTTHIQRVDLVICGIMSC